MDILIEKSVEILVTGLVQGVGFRPFVFRIATQFGLSGWVQNTNENVRIQITGKSLNINQFINNLKSGLPPAAMIEDLSVKEIDRSEFSGFRILGSNDISDQITEISPDIAVCHDCLEDMNQPGTRHDYAFVNCTNCGPRFTIIQDLPYDRAKTTMNSFALCPDCLAEYETISDRRFHAQPTACIKCGPHYELVAENISVSTNIGDILIHISTLIDNGGIVLIKGLGGMHLACDAFNEGAVSRLRELKNREGKPFAVMFSDIDNLKLYADIDPLEEQSLTSWRRPIVLLKKKIHLTPPTLTSGLNAGLDLLGVMLPYMPVHFLLFRQLKTAAIVLTSGNFSNEPILIDNQQAIKMFSPHVDAMVLHNREIYNRTDDSVVKIMAGKERVFRRSRGYVPTPVRTALNMEGIVAFGAELTNCFCVGKGHKAFLSQHIGDLQGIETTQFYENTIEQFIKLFRIKPAMIAIDMHPDYISTKTGLSYSNLPIVSVQHHHAHIASCMVEHRLDERVIGIALDGTGYGTDGNTWGSEFMVCDLNEFERVSHFEYLPMPGGDLAAEQPWRMAIASLYQVFGADLLNLEIPFIKQMDTDKASLIIQMMAKNINCPLTSGAGRLFDAVAALLGLVHEATFQAEGPMRLESLVKPESIDQYSFTIDNTIQFQSTILGIVEDITNGIQPDTIATKFHNTIISVIFSCANTIRMNTGINKAVLSGGVFQNKYLLEGATNLLEKNNFEVFSQASVPTNDGGIALGQLAVAAKRRELKCV